MRVSKTGEDPQILELRRLASEKCVRLEKAMASLRDAAPEVKAAKPMELDALAPNQRLDDSSRDLGRWGVCASERTPFKTGS